MELSCPAQEALDLVFPPERTQEFFDALYGDAEEGAYDIHLICREVTERRAVFAYELRCRPGKCLRCNLTYGLPQVFQRHPVIKAEATAKELAAALGWKDPIIWKLGATEETSRDRHYIPLIIEKAGA